jgi:hypothetical protein
VFKFASFLILIEDTKIMLVSLPCSKCTSCGFGVEGCVFAYYLPGMVEMVAASCGRSTVTFSLREDIAERSKFQVDNFFLWLELLNAVSHGARYNRVAVDCFDPLHREEIFNFDVS